MSISKLNKVDSNKVSGGRAEKETYPEGTKYFFTCKNCGHTWTRGADCKPEETVGCPHCCTYKMYSENENEENPCVTYHEINT